MNKPVCTGDQSDSICIYLNIQFYVNGYAVQILQGKSCFSQKKSWPSLKNGPHLLFLGRYCDDLLLLFKKQVLGFIHAKFVAGLMEYSLYL